MPEVSDLYVEALEGYVDLLEPALEGVLCEANARRIKAFARNVPANALRYFGFEWPLGTNAFPGVDFAMNLSASGLAWLKVPGRWPRVQHILRTMDASVRTDPENVWLEWDARHGVSSGEPSLYVTIDDIGALRTFENPALNALADRNANALQRCIRAVPAIARRLHVGFMLQRPQAGLRVGVLTMNADAAATFLCDAGWRGDSVQLQSLLESFSDVCDGFSIQVDCTDQGIALVASELIFHGAPQDRQPAGQPRWYLLLERLVECGYATLEQVSRLIEWPARRHFTAPLIERMMASAALGGPGRLLDGTLVTGLQHVKLVTRDGLNVRAKAYFGAEFLDGV